MRYADYTENDLKLLISHKKAEIKQMTISHNNLKYLEFSPYSIEKVRLENIKEQNKLKSIEKELRNYSRG